MVSYVLLPFSMINGFFLFIFTLNLVILLFLAGRNRPRCRVIAKRLDRFPTVTIQIPLYNERYVAERVIRGAV